MAMRLSHRVLIPAITLCLFAACSQATTFSSTAVSSSSANDIRPFDAGKYTIERIVKGLNVPWSIVFTSPSRMLVTERGGSVRVIENGMLTGKPLHMFDEVSSASEEGLMGMALDPAYAVNRYIYLSLAYPKGSALFVKVIRMTDAGDRLADERTIIDGIPAAQNHAGSRLRFGPDGMLYVTTGDATDRPLAQRMDSLAGKILRLAPDGGIPPDNPFPGSPVYTLGHRNPQGIDWHPVTGALYSTEHGPSGFDGPGGGDELNRIVTGKNYGWPVVSHERTDPRFESPLKVWTPAQAPASGMFYSDDRMPELKHSFFFGALKGQGIWRIVFGDDGTSIALAEKLSIGDYGRIRDVAQGPDGAIYFTTSNRDGRGRPREGDDGVYRLAPK